MDDKLSILDILGVGIVRKQVLNKLYSFMDINNLTKSCKWINFYIYNDKIRRNMFCFTDFPKITIRVKDGNVANPIMPSLEDIEFRKDEESLKVLNEGENFLGEAIVKKDQILLYINNYIENVREGDYELFIRKFVQEMDINRPIRKTATILDFGVPSCNRHNIQYNHHMILYALSYMHHENITRVVVPTYSFMSDSIKYRELRHNIFNGFPKLHELVIYGSLLETDYTKLINNRSTFENILRELATKENATLVLVHLNREIYPVFNFVRMVMEMAERYNIKVKCDAESLIDPRKEIVSSNERYSFISIADIITSVKCSIGNPKIFINFMKNVQFLRNLETLDLSYRIMDIERSCKTNSDLDAGFISFKHCKKLRKIKLKLAESFDSNYGFKNDKLLNVIKFIISLMPTSVEILELWHVYNINEEFTGAINDFLPNIKVLRTFDVSYKDPECLGSFKNLQALLLCDNYPTKVPDTVKLLALKYLNKEDDDEESMFANQALLECYSKKFTKSLQDIDGTHIFFNNIGHWDMYKRAFWNIFE
uniref:F-box domain-containing protein n=1 Tax=Strongyloides papillosus TaxID=174720 RepID=A0A0N5BCV2_STREA